MQKSRRKFLQLSSLALLSTSIPAPVYAINSFVSKKTSVDMFNDAKEIAKRAKLHFIKKEYAVAESLYKQCISLVPKDIRFYDNLKAVYGAQGKYIESLKLFKQALQINQKNVAFYDRTARCLLQLETGNKKLATQYKAGKSISLLHEAENFYTQAIQLDKDKKYLKIGLKKVRQKINEANLDYRVDKGYKKAKKKRKRVHKKRFHKYSIEALETQLYKLQTQRRKTLYTEKEIQNRDKNTLAEQALLLSLLVKRYKKNKEYDNAISCAFNWYELSPNDSEVIKKIERLFLKMKDFVGLIEFRRHQITKTPNLWSYFGLIKAIERGYKKRVVNSLDEIITICDELLTPKWRVSKSLRAIILEKKAQVFTKQKKFELATENYESILKNFELQSPQFLNRILNSYCIMLLKSKKSDVSKTILESIIYKEQIDLEKNKEIPEFVINNLSLAHKDENKLMLPLYYTLYRVYKKDNNHTTYSTRSASTFSNEKSHGKRRSILNEIIAIEPNNKFANKRI